MLFVNINVIMIMPEIPFTVSAVSFNNMFKEIRKFVVAEIFGHFRLCAVDAAMRNDIINAPPMRH